MKVALVGATRSTAQAAYNKLQRAGSDQLNQISDRGRTRLPSNLLVDRFNQTNE
jgi:hypothetical protein